MGRYFNDIPDDTPVYQLLTACYLEDDTLHPADEIIAYENEPNEYMLPLNEPARARMQTLVDKLDRFAREKAELVGRPFTGRVKDMGDQIQEAMTDTRTLARKVEIAEPIVTSDLPQRPDLIPIGKRPPPKRGVVGTRTMSAAPTQVKTIQGRNYDKDAASNSR